MTTSRIEAFSDGVIAIIITIMVLELHAPDQPTLHALREATGTSLLTYVLSFVYIGIYWVNHHHVFQLTQHVTGGVLWANLHLLFWLSLYPFTTRWMDEQDLSRTTVVIYGVNLIMAAVAYTILVLAIVRNEGPNGPMAQAIGSDAKGKASLAIYGTGIALAFVQVSLSVVCFVVVAVIWLIPDRRLERYLAEHHLEDT